MAGRWRNMKAHSPPPLTIARPTPGGEDPRDLETFSMVGPMYLWGVAGYAAGLTPAPPPAGPRPDDDDPGNYRS